MKVKLDARNVRSLRPGPDGTRGLYHDTVVPGLRLEVFASGVRSFVAWYRVKGSRRAGRTTLGRYAEGVYSLADARDDAREVLALARKGVDPAAKKRQDKAAGTFGDLLETFLADAEKRVRPATIEGWRGFAAHDDLRTLRGMRLPDVTRRDVIHTLDKIAKRAPITANRNLELIRAAFNHGIGKDLVAASPCVGIGKPSAEKKRRRSYTDDEVRAVLSVLEDTGFDAAVRLVWFTGVRISEALGARWQEFDFEKAVWTIQGERAGRKNGEDLLVPLSPQALALLERLPRAGDFVFPAPKRKESGKGHAWRQQRAIYRIREESGVADFRLHDVRRCVTTYLASQKVPREVRDAVLGHKLTGLEEAYNRYAFLKEKKQALTRWCAHLTRVMATDEKDEKVVPLARPS